MSRCAQEAGKEVFRGRQCLQAGAPSVYSRGGAPWIRTQKLGGLEEAVGSEDGGDDLAGGVDGAFAV